jgi:hypothetical protein
MSLHDRTSDEYREYVRRLVDTFPPVTPEQKAEIGAALRGGAARRRLADRVASEAA